ncbi:MAG: succinylglutamate desuccinylase/aspartoacylase family protein [Haloferacaceae archaeon]
MRVVTIGEGDPEVAAVGAVHGDEPCGARAIERFRAEDREVRRPAKLIVASERALERGERFVDADLNRSFPGDPDGDRHEERLAHDLLAEVEGLLTLGFHATVSFDEPFGTLAHVNAEKARVMRALPLEHAADFTGVVEGRSVNLPRFVNVEAGYQGSDRAAENAYECLVAFLRFAGVLSGDPAPTETVHYRVRETVEKRPGRSYEVHARNFERVPPGEPYAAADGELLSAEEPFWPVLMSADGHDRLLGYKAERTGPVAAAVEGDAN